MAIAEIHYSTLITITCQQVSSDMQISPQSIQLSFTNMILVFLLPSKLTQKKPWKGSYEETRKVT